MTLEFIAKPGGLGPRPSFAVENHWLMRALLALLLVVGMFGINRATPGASRSEPVSEGEREEVESTKVSGAQALAKRRSRFEGGPPELRIASARAPRSLLASARARELPRPTWERPRRSPPSGDGDGGDDECS